MEQLPLFVPDSKWSPPTSLPDIRNAGLIALDVETRDEQLNSFGCGGFRGAGELVGLSIATDQGFSGYFPIKHPSSANFGKRVLIDWLKDQLAAGAPVVGHNLGYDLEWLRVEGLRITNPICDTQVAAGLLDESRYSYSLDSVARDYLGERKDEKLLREAAAAYGVDPKSGLWKLPASFVGPYAEQDAVLALRLWKVQEPLLKEQDLWEVYQLESKIVNAVLNMRQRGVRLDTSAAEQLLVQYRQEEKETRKAIKDLVGWDLDIHSTPKVAAAFNHLGIRVPFTAKGNESVTAPWLEKQEHPLARLIVQAKQLTNMANNYVGKLLSMEVNGRIYASFTSTKGEDGDGTKSGRFSMSRPNLQQIPNRNPRYKKDIRGLFIPDNGFTWMKADYSQQEFRWAVEIASKLKCRGANIALKQYQEDERTDFHTMVANLAQITRKQAKPINLGTMYGMGRQKLTNQLNMPYDAAEQIFERYHEKLPWVKEVANAAARVASDRGYVLTFLKRRRRFNKWEIAGYGTREDPTSLEIATQRVKDPYSPWYNQPIRRAETNNALNSVCQGSSADQTKLAMVIAEDEGIPIQITVHDELDTGMANPDQQKKLAEIMKTCCNTAVPFYVGIDISKNWGVSDEE